MAFKLSISACAVNALIEALVIPNFLKALFNGANTVRFGVVDKAVVKPVLLQQLLKY
jgi:hypothetical protein